MLVQQKILILHGARLLSTNNKKIEVIFTKQPLLCVELDNPSWHYNTIYTRISFGMKQ